MLHYAEPGESISRLSVLEVAGTNPTLLCPCGHGTVCTTPPGNELPPLCLIAPLDHDRQEDVVDTIIIVLAAISVLVSTGSLLCKRRPGVKLSVVYGMQVGFTVNSFERNED